MDADGRITALRMHVVADVGAYPDLHVHPGPHADDGRRRLSASSTWTSATRASSPTRRRSPRTAAPGGRRPPTTSSGSWTASPPSWDARPRRSDGRTSFRPTPSRTPRRPDRTTTAASTTGALTRALRWRATTRSAPSSASASTRGDRRLLGIGMACYVEMCGFGPFESAIVRVEPSGTVTAYTGTSAARSGARDHLRPDHRRSARRGLRRRSWFATATRATTPMGFGTGGSRSLAVGGSAMLQAAGKVQEKARRIAASMLEAAVEDVELRDGRYQVRGVPTREPDPRQDRRARLRRSPGAGARARRSRPPSTSGLRSSSTPSAPTWPSSRWTARRGA